MKNFKTILILIALVWTFEWVGNKFDISEFLNKLPEARALEAKVITADSSKGFDRGYYVFYRKEV